MKRFICLLVVLGVIIGVSFLGCDDGTKENKPDAVLVCFGDSLTAGHISTFPHIDDKTKSYPAFLQKKVKIPVINAGKCGDTSTMGLARVDTDVVAENPDIVVIELGANDLLHAFLEGLTIDGLPGLVATTQSNLQSIIDKLDNGKRKIYLAKFYTPTVASEMFSRPEFGVSSELQTALVPQYDAMFTALATTSTGVELIEDIWTGVWGLHMSDDGVHADAAGYEIMAGNYFNVLRPYLQKNKYIK